MIWLCFHSRSNIRCMRIYGNSQRQSRLFYWSWNNVAAHNLNFCSFIPSFVHRPDSNLFVLLHIQRTSFIHGVREMHSVCSLNVNWLIINSLNENQEESEPRWTKKTRTNAVVARFLDNKLPQLWLLWSCSLSAAASPVTLQTDPSPSLLAKTRCHLKVGAFDLHSIWFRETIWSWNCISVLLSLPLYFLHSLCQCADKGPHYEPSTASLWPVALPCLWGAAHHVLHHVSKLSE